MAEKEKILLIHNCAGIGGGSWCLLEIIQEIDRSRYEVDVVLGGKGELHQALQKLGIKTHFCELPTLGIGNPGYRKFFSIGSLRDIVLLAERIKRVQQLIKEVGPDVIYLNTSVLFIIAWAARRCCSSRVILHIREHFRLPLLDPRRGLWKLVVNRDVDRIFSISHVGAELAGVGERTTIARDWVDFSTRGDNISVDIYKEYGLPTGRPFILLTGGTDAAKGSLNAIKAFEMMKNKEAICVVLGGQSDEKAGLAARCKAVMKRIVCIRRERDEIKRLVGNSDRIFLLPKVLCVKQFMEAARIVVCVYNIPHCAKPALEAAFFSKIAIVADDPEGREYVKDGRTGFVVPPGNPGLLAEQMDCVLNNSVDVHAIGTCAKAYVEDEFSKIKSVGTILAAISAE